MEVQEDYRELLESLNAREVEFIVVGAYALAHQGAPRATGYLDILVRPTDENAGRIVKALKDFGFEFPDLTAGDFREPDRVIQLGVPPVRVDLITSLTGVTWEEAFSGREEASYGGVPIFYMGPKELVAKKRALGRKRDLADLEALGET